MECLYNPTEEQILDREPLLKYSFFLSDRNNWVVSASYEIISNLDKGFTDKILNTEHIGKASMATWFWVLGAYEIIRTITQTKDCFSEDFIDSLQLLKKSFAQARMPSAKMEKKGKRIPVNSNRSHDNWDIKNKDLIIGDPDNPLSVRYLIKQYNELFSSLKKEDVLKRHEDSHYYS